MAAAARQGLAPAGKAGSAIGGGKGADPDEVASVSQTRILTYNHPAIAFPCRQGRGASGGRVREGRRLRRTRPR